MAWSKYNNYNSNEDGEKDLVYDLRQGLAQRLNFIMDEIAVARLHRDYKKWYENMDTLFIEISMKLEPEEQNEYHTKIKELNENIDEEPEVYLNQQIEGRNIYMALKKIDMWLREMMDKYNMFGAKEMEDDGL